MLMAIALCTACNTSVRAQPIPTVPPQPTPNKTLDAVVRGLIVPPTPTRATPTRPVVEHTRAPVLPPEPRLATATEVGARTALPTATRVAAQTAAIVTSTPRVLPTDTRVPATIPTMTTAPAHINTPASTLPQRLSGPGSQSEEPVGAVRAPPTPTRLREP